jgi:hypothetical protein
MSIQCENCITLAICLTQIKFTFHEDEPKPRLTLYANIFKRCSYFRSYLQDGVMISSFNEIKEFFLKQKGFI